MENIPILNHLYRNKEDDEAYKLSFPYKFHDDKNLKYGETDF